MNVIALVIFAFVQILFIPLAVLGLILIIYKQVYVSWQLGVSSTAVEVINGRWIMHIFGLREDRVSLQLHRALPNNSVLGLWLIFFPSYLRYRICGRTYGYPVIPQQEEEGLSHLVTARTLYFDLLIDKYRNSIEQFVCLGAGFDTRCFSRLKSCQVHCFELDKEKTQQLKIASLSKAGIDASHVTFVPVDFAKPHWYEKLKQAGYDSAKRTMFLWEGVTLYLNEKSVRTSLREIRRHSAIGSVVLCDIYAKSFVEGEYASGMKSPQVVMKASGEQFGFGLELSGDAKLELTYFMASEGLRLQDTYLMGARTKNGIFMAVLEATTIPSELIL
ncbi:class I SAM-dependent methyltransferase [Photobacterium chitinilyticum]|uniref:S-adenosyl-L-methionine-dependent methyltransferase n=1 Tax=Photobacterium chitinilyticum TaxID=2485123 RepID=A0A444JX11_9GAMM|nr:SAM-dependent methyltransferase [Photobacterium chitinilyticum]RWX57558.1 class I SAM-dependent methyltransferase [Photobacterium chitinilyticum]